MTATDSAETRDCGGDVAAILIAVGDQKLASSSQPAQTFQAEVTGSSGLAEVRAPDRRVIQDRAELVGT